MSEEPDQVNINGIPHKIGLRGRVYMRVCGDWLLSSKALRTFESAKAGKRNVNRDVAVNY